MIRRFRPVLALPAIAVLLVGGCGGSAATPTPTPVPTPISDPYELIVRSLYETWTADSVHVRADLSGKISMSVLGAGGSILGALGAAIDLNGAHVDGDVDIQSAAADLKFEVPGFPLGLSGEVVVVDGYMYTRISLQGDKFTRSGMSGSLATPAPSGSGSAAQIEELRRSIVGSGVTAAMKPREYFEGRECYRATVTMPPGLLNRYLAQAGEYAARLSIESATLDYWVYRDSLLPAKVELTANAGSMGNLEASVLLSNYGAPVTIKAPDPSQVNG